MSDIAEQGDQTVADCDSNQENAGAARSLKAVLFSDMRGYSALMSTNEERALRLLAEHDRIITPIVELHHGRLIKKIGDALMVSFGSGGDAVDCAVDIQESLARHNEPLEPDDRIVIRIGIHVGEIIERENDLFGHGVNLAARLEPLAPPGGIAVSETVVALLKARPKFTFHAAGEHQVKNLEEPLSVFHVGGAEGEHGDALAGAQPKSTDGSKPGLETELSLNEARRAVRPAGIVLIVLGSLNWLAIIGSSIALGVMNIERTGAIIGVLAWGFVMSFAAIFGGLRMMQLRSRRLAIVGCVGVMLMSPLNTITFPFAIWGLTVLMRPQLKAAFARVAQ